MSDDREPLPPPPEVVEEQRRQEAREGSIDFPTYLEGLAKMRARLDDPASSWALCEDGKIRRKKPSDQPRTPN
jgi:hypothetical protein